MSEAVDGDSSPTESIEPISKLLQSLFNVGDFVKVQDTFDAYIMEVNEVNGKLLFKVKYVIDNRVENYLGIEDIRVINFYNSDIHTSRSGATRQYNSSSIDNVDQNENNVDTCPQYNENNSNEDTNVEDDVSADSDSPDLTEFKHILKECFYFKSYKDTKLKLLYNYLKKGKRLYDKGWLKNIIRQKDVPVKTHMSSTEKTILSVIATMFFGYSSIKGPMQNHMEFTQYTFGVSEYTRRNIITSFVDTNFSFDRKTRSDKGTSVFDSETVRKRTFTPFNSYKRRKLREWRETTENIPYDILRNDFNSKSDSEKQAYEIMAERDLERSKSLWDEVKTILLRTKGKISFREIANYLNNIISPNTIREYLSNQPTFSIRKDRILPALDKQAMKRRYIWVQKFWLFWSL